MTKVNEGRTCLLVEDDDVTAFLSMRVLNEQKSFDQVVRVESGEEALDLCSKQSFDLIILDYSLPGMDGGQFIEAYSRLDRKISVSYANIIIVSSSDDLEEYDKLTEREDVIGVLRKPLRPNHLIELCSECFQS